MVGSSSLSICWDFVALEENSLGQASVLLSVFQNVNSVILQVIEQGALVDAEVFDRLVRPRDMT